MINTSSKQDFMKRLFRHNLREKILAVFCTLVIMLVAVCLKPVSKVYSIRVNANISPDHVLVSENIDNIEVKVSGNFFELRKIKSEDLVMNFDFSKESVGEIALNIGEKELPAVFLTLDVKSISPQTLVFRTEEKKVEPAEPVETLPETSPKDEKTAETESEAASDKPDENTVKTETGEKND